jgi:gluconokinase
MERPILLMGVSGSGKTTVGELLATELRVTFVDGDDLHPPQNKKKMASGIPLNDADRAPWLDAVGAVLAKDSAVVACSALRRPYRDRIRAVAPALRLVYLKGSRALLAERVSARKHAFMPAVLLDSQLATLEEPGVDEDALTVDVAQGPQDIVACIVGWYGAGA